MDEPKQPDGELKSNENGGAARTYDLLDEPSDHGVQTPQSGQDAEGQPRYIDDSPEADDLEEISEEDGGDQRQTLPTLDDEDETAAEIDAEGHEGLEYGLEELPPPPEAPPTPEPQHDMVGEPTGDLHLADALSIASELLTANFALIAGGSFVVTTSLLGPGVFTLTAPLMVGHMRTILKRLNGETVEFGEVFSGFHEYKRTLVAGLILLGIVICASCVLTVGSWLLMHVLWPWLAATLSIVANVVVGVGIASLLYFALPMVAFSQAKPTDALRASAAFGLLHPAAMALLAICTAVVALAGILVAGLGWLVTFPLATVLQIVAYREFYLPNAAVAAQPQAEADVA